MSISLSVMPWMAFQSDGHFDTSMVKPDGPTYRFLLVGSWPYLPVPAAGMIGAAAAVVVGPPLVGAELAAAVVGAAVVPAAVAGVLPLLSPPHAAATNANDTSSVVGASHRCFATKSPDVRRHANEAKSAAPGAGRTTADG